MVTNESPGAVLSPEEAWELLHGCRRGRLALSSGDRPDILLVSLVAFAERNTAGRMTLRSGSADLPSALHLNNRVAFEADEVQDGTAWSVVVRGTARVLDGEPDGAGSTIEITPSFVSGRRFVLGPEPDRW